MIPENRESIANNIREDCIQALESYLRQEASYDAMSRSHVAEGMEKRLAMKAKDYCTKYGNMTNDDTVYTLLAREAVTRYMDNWENKTQGDDNRGKRLGKSSYGAA